MPVSCFVTALAACLGSAAVAGAQEAKANDPLTVVSAFETVIADAIEKAQPSVVAITRIRSASGETLAIRGSGAEPPVPVDGPLGSERPGFPDPGQGDASTRSPEAYALPGDFGGGVVVGEQGQILTCYHLLRGAAQIRVRGMGTVFDAEIIAADPRIDLAVIVPRSGTLPPGLRPMPIGKAETLRQGNFLIALGNPYNAARDGQASASLGILSNKARKLDPPADAVTFTTRQLFRFQPTLMQLDSKLNLGMSGGAVVNLRGELVGLTNSEASPQGFDAAAGYAIPLDELGRRAVAELVQGKEVEYSFIGISLDQTPNTVRDVVMGTPAWKADLRSGDRILSVDGRELSDTESALTLALARVPVGQPVKLTVLRDGKTVELTLTMSKYPLTAREGEVIATNRPPLWRGAQVDFSSVLGGEEFFSTSHFMSRGGVGIVEVAPGSPAAAAGLETDTVITAVEGQSVSTPTEFRAAVAEREGKPVKLSVVGRIDPAPRAVTVPPK